LHKKLCQFFKKPNKTQKTRLEVCFLGGFFWVLLGGFFIANPDCHRPELAACIACYQSVKLGIPQCT
jgi:hypothetical protein